jgi:hypothetical protein
MSDLIAVGMVAGGIIVACVAAHNIRQLRQLRSRRQEEDAEFLVWLNSIVYGAPAEGERDD